MISNNKNKNTKELTLEEIIQNATFRKKFKNMCLLDKNYKKDNKDQGRVNSIVNNPI